MSKTLKRIMAVLSVVLFGSGMFFLGFYVRNLSSPDMTSLKFVIEHYKKYYYEEEDNYVEIMANSLLDAYSKYYTAEEYELIQKGAKGVRVGIGVTVQNRSEGVYIANVIYNSPTEVAGITEGNYITSVKINGGEFVSVDFSTFSSMMDGIKLGDKLIIRLNGEEKEYSVDVREYTETYVSYTDGNGTYRFTDGGGKTLSLKQFKYDLTEQLPTDTAYIKYKSFNGTSNNLYGSAKQIQTVLNKFKEDGKKKLILDLRGNGGGFMDIMCEVCSFFIGVNNGAKPLVSRAIYKDGKVDKFNSTAVKYGDYGFEKIIILADSGTASASEAFIGACLDYDYKNIVRVVLSQRQTADGFVYRTYGKGIMQTTFENVMGGDAIKLTTAKIYWPKSDISIHEVGITKNLTVFKDKIIEAPYIENADYELIAGLSLLN
ncbi:MAG: hypothetical protein E7360_00765 [Clostridiales bacterium]|nr:hypothetical protein [Clostridiales bacterium]